ncbi:LysR substrate-binding domain-containing protein [Thiotrichales bacterium 19S3-7]|nr:LysR substrate-binding domain-containing protein [Thiotrichales bacterium 19S3-7]MCF6802598.1 LysR substrate-binding domain-containing protein [Thiotrichales bacterium 19S3-11]
MNIRDLEYIVAVAEEKSFVKASQLCFVSQPALSMQVKKLEDQLGIVIFERQHKQVLLTKAGDVIVTKAKEVLQQVNDLKLIAKRFVQPLKGVLKFGLFPTIAQYILPDLLEVLQNNFSDMQLHPVEEKTPIIEAQLKEGNLDCALLAAPVDERIFRFIPLFDDYLFAAVPKMHPLTELKQVSLKDFAEEPLLLLEEGHCLRTQALEFCAKSEHPFNINRTTTSLESLRHMVASGLGVTVIPEIAIKYSPYQSQQIAYIPFSSPKPFRKIGLVFRKSHPNHTLQEQLSKKLIEHFNSY